MRPPRTRPSTSQPAQVRMARPIEDSDPLVKLRPACEPGAHSLRTAPASRVGPLLLPCRPNIGAATRTQMRPGEGSRTARRRAWLVVLGLAVLLAAPARAGLAPGDVLGAENWQEARGILPEEFLDAYRRGVVWHRHDASEVLRPDTWP